MDHNIPVIIFSSFEQHLISDLSSPQAFFFFFFFLPLLQQINKAQRSSTHSFVKCILIPFSKPGCTDYNEEGQSDETCRNTFSVTWTFASFFSFFTVCFSLKYSIATNTLMHLHPPPPTQPLFSQRIWKWSMNMEKQGYCLWWIYA